MRVTGPLFKWFGSKWLSSKKLPPPKHNTIVEPYAGGAGYSLRYGAGKLVILAERDPHLRVLWDWLICDATETLIREIPVGVPEGTDIQTLGLTLGQATLLKTWQRTNNVGDCWTTSPWGTLPGQWTPNTRARVAEEFEAVRGWFLFHSARDAFMHKERNPQTTWFIDPCYQYNYQYRGEPTNYKLLATEVKRLRGQVIVCEAVCPKTGAVPNYLPFKPFEERLNSRHAKGMRSYSKELIYTKG